MKQNASDRHDGPQDPHAREGQRPEAAAEDDRADEKAPASGGQQSAGGRRLGHARREPDHHHRQCMIQAVANSRLPVVAAAVGVEHRLQAMRSKRARRYGESAQKGT